MSRRNKTLIFLLIVIFAFTIVFTYRSVPATIAVSTTIRHGLGLKPSVNLKNTVKPTISEYSVAPSSLPPSVDLSNFLPPVGDQGRQNSCTAWAVGYYYKTFEEKKENGWDVTTAVHQFSPAFIYNVVHSDGSTDGTTFSDAFNILKNLGCDTLNYFPYNENDSSTQPTSEQLQLAKPFVISSYSLLFQGRGVDADTVPTTDWVWKGTALNDTDLNNLKGILAGGDIFVIAVPVFADWYTSSFGPSDYIHTVPSDGGETFYGYHALTVVGYDNDKYGGSFKIVNSWGSDWGDGGFTWITYDWFKECVEEGWVMTDRSPDFSVSIQQPNGGETLNGNSNYDIKWSCNDAGGGSCAFAVNADLYVDFGNGNWTKIWQGSNASKNYNWLVPNDAYNDCKMKIEIKDVSNFVLSSDVSDSTFSISPSNSTSQTLTLHFTANKFTLVSFPFTVSSQDIPNFIKAYTFDWTHFWTTPTTFEPGKGYWIKVSQDEDVTLTGTPSTTNTTITITPGKFNLIGNPFNTPIDISQLNTSNDNHIIAIYTFDWTHFWQLWTPNTTQNFTTLQPGKAYWIKFDSNAPTTFTIPMP